MGREYPEYPILSVGAIILDGDMIVLVKRGAQPSAGKWSIPGGAVEIGEGIVDAVKREAFEETGLTVEVKSLIEVVEYVERDNNGDVKYHYVILDFMCKPAGRKIVRPGGDVLDAKWFRVEEALTLPLTISTRKLLLKLVKYRDIFR